MFFVLLSLLICDKKSIIIKELDGFKRWVLVKSESSVVNEVGFCGVLVRVFICVRIVCKYVKCGDGKVVDVRVAKGRHRRNDGEGDDDAL